MNLGKKCLLTALTGLALACPIWAQNAAPPAGGGKAAFANEAPPPPMPNFCPPGVVGRNIVYPFDGPDCYCPPENAFFSNREVQGPVSGTLNADPMNYYLGIGGMALRRTELNRQVVATLAPPLSFTDPNPVDLQTTPISFLPGIRGEFGINFGAGVLELSGFYLFPTSSSYSAAGIVNPLNPFPLFGNTAFFANFPTPAGFNAALWSNVNAPFTVALNYGMSMGNLELNYRFPVSQRAVLVLGLRYLDLQEHLDIVTSDAAGSTDYFVGVHTRLVGPQIGIELEQPVIRNVSIEGIGKLSGGPNFYNVTHTLTQSNGPAGPGSDVNGVQVSGLFEFGLFANVWIVPERVRIHAGYQIMWLFNVPEVQAQVNVNPNIGVGTQDYHNSYFFHGPLVEVMFTF